MSSSHQACFMMEVVNVFHLDVKDHVAFDKLDYMLNIPAVLLSIKCNTDILHFLGDDIYPEDGSSTSVNGQGIVH